MGLDSVLELIGLSVATDVGAFNGRLEIVLTTLSLS